MCIRDSRYTGHYLAISLSRGHALLPSLSALQSELRSILQPAEHPAAMHNPALQRGSPAHLQALFAHLWLRRCHRELLRPVVKVPDALTVSLLLQAALRQHPQAPQLVVDVVHGLAVALEGSVWEVGTPGALEEAVAAQWDALNADGRAAIAHLVSVSPGAPCVTATCLVVP